MKNTSSAVSKFLITATILSFFILAAPAFAQKPTATPGPKTATPGPKLTQASLRSCQAREAAVKNRMDSLVRLVENIESKFDAIALRVENFYTEKVLPTGKTVPNYDKLVADISAKKDVVAKDLDVAKANTNSFSCTTDDPRGMLRQFKMDMQKVKTDLKNYRTSIKNLIVAVRPLAPKASPEASETPKGTEKPEPTETPEATPTP